MNHLFKCCLVLGAMAASFAAVPVGAAPHTPAKGSSERTAIMNAMRRVVGRNFRKRVVFVPDKFKVERGWAYFDGGFQFSDGTRLYDLHNDNLMQEYAGGGVEALLHKEGGAWKVKRLLHPSDVETPQIMADFPQAPRAIFR